MFESILHKGSGSATSRKNKKDEQLQPLSFDFPWPEINHRYIDE